MIFSLSTMVNPNNHQRVMSLKHFSKHLADLIWEGGLSMSLKDFYLATSKQCSKKPKSTKQISWRSFIKPLSNSRRDHAHLSLLHCYSNRGIARCSYSLTEQVLNHPQTQGSVCWGICKNVLLGKVIIYNLIRLEYRKDSHGNDSYTGIEWYCTNKYWHYQLIHVNTMRRAFRFHVKTIRKEIS